MHWKAESAGGSALMGERRRNIDNSVGNSRHENSDISIGWVSPMVFGRQGSVVRIHSLRPIFQGVSRKSQNQKCRTIGTNGTHKIHGLVSAGHASRRLSTNSLFNENNVLRAVTVPMLRECSPHYGQITARRLDTSDSEAPK